jgi:hypothetical protein
MLAGSAAYGSTFGARGPGVSTSRESISPQPSGAPRVTNAVPRTSRTVSIDAPVARRCATSTIARSALP